MTAMFVLLAVLSAAVVAAAVVPLAYAIGVDELDSRERSVDRDANVQAHGRDRRVGGLTAAGSAA